MKIVNNTRISIKLVAAFATLVLIIACLAGVTAYELSQARDRVADTTRITYITDDVNALRQEVARQQAAVRGLLLSGNRDYIGKYETAKAEYERRLASLQPRRSEEHTSELQSLMRISYAVFCLKKKKKTQTFNNRTIQC